MNTDQPVSLAEIGQATTGIPDKKNYTLKEAALFLNVSTRTVERLIARRLLRRNKALRKILIPRTELDRFLEGSL
jgi:excisionase family DNA binding protein